MGDADSKCPPDLDRQEPHGIGHNGGPETDLQRMYQMVGPKKTTPAPTYQCGAPWTGYATDDELKELGKRQARVDMKQAVIDAEKAEMRKTRGRCIKRMRRDQGKD